MKNIKNSYQFRLFFFVKTKERENLSAVLDKNCVTTGFGLINITSEPDDTVELKVDRAETSSLRHLTENRVSYTIYIGIPDKTRIVHRILCGDRAFHFNFYKCYLFKKNIYCKPDPISYRRLYIYRALYKNVKWLL